jgi:GNAT superfamily N-acetyltransferase
MYPRQTRREFERRKGDPNRRAMRRLVASGSVPGVLGYLDEEPVGWCSVEPREVFSTLARSRILKPVDDRPVWSIVCLFVHKDHRGKGISVRMIRGAARWAASQGARLVEAYPVEPRRTPMPPAFAWNGLASAYLAAGFREVARRSETRPIMRRAVRPGRAGGR